MRVGVCAAPGGLGKRRGGRLESAAQAAGPTASQHATGSWLTSGHARPTGTWHATQQCGWRSLLAFCWLHDNNSSAEHRPLSPSPPALPCSSPHHSVWVAGIEGRPVQQLPSVVPQVRARRDGRRRKGAVAAHIARGRHAHRARRQCRARARHPSLHVQPAPAGCWTRQAAGGHAVSRGRRRVRAGAGTWPWAVGARAARDWPACLPDCLSNVQCKLAATAGSR